MIYFVSPVHTPLSFFDGPGHVLIPLAQSTAEDLLSKMDDVDTVSNGDSEVLGIEWWSPVNAKWVSGLQSAVMDNRRYDLAEDFQPVSKEQKGLIDIDPAFLDREDIKGHDADVVTVRVRTDRLYLNARCGDVPVESWALEREMLQEAASKALA